MARSLGPSQKTGRKPWSHTNSNFVHDVKNYSGVFRLAVSKGGFWDRRVAEATKEDGDRCPTSNRFPNTGDTLDTCNATPSPAEPSAHLAVSQSASN